MYFFYAKELN